MTMQDRKMDTGSCLCGLVRYEISGGIGEMGHCLCVMCQKAHGAAFGTYAKVTWKQFKLLNGEAEIKHYESSEGIQRSFCGNCGSTLQFIYKDKPHFGLAVGTLDTEPSVEPTYQIWTSSKAPWWQLQEGLLSHETQPGYQGNDT